jgi:hypothetical protein
MTVEVYTSEEGCDDFDEDAAGQGVGNSQRMSDGSNDLNQENNPAHNSKSQQPITKVIKITTPDIINGRIKSIEVHDERYHSVSL